MAKWTKKAAIARMQTNQELQQVYDKYPLTKILVESAASFRRYHGYHRISCYYAYKDWVWAATQKADSEAGWVVVKVVDDLLPPDVCDLEIEGRAIYSNNPHLHKLPLLPEKSQITAQKESPYRFKLLNLSQFRELYDAGIERHKVMYQMLLKLQQEKV